MQLSAPARAMEVGCKLGDGRSKGAAREHPNENSKILRTRNQFLDPDASDMQWRNRCAHVSIPFISADDEAACFSHCEIRAGHSGISGHKKRPGSLPHRLS